MCVIIKLNQVVGDVLVALSERIIKKMWILERIMPLYPI